MCFAGLAIDLNWLLGHITLQETQLWPLIDAQHECQTTLKSLVNAASADGQQYVRQLDTLVTTMNQYEALLWQIVPVQLYLRLKLQEFGQLTANAVVKLEMYDTVMYESMEGGPNSSGYIEEPSTELTKPDCFAAASDGELLEIQSDCGIE